MKLGAKLSARICQIVSKRRQRTGIYADIAEHLAKNIKDGNLIDIGMGAGLLLFEINKINPKIKLYGIDISEEVCKIAQKNLEKLDVSADIRSSSIEEAEFPKNFFDIITSTASFSYCKEPLLSLKEFFKILKPEGKAILFEPHKEVDIKKLEKSIKNALKDANKVRRCLAIGFNKFAIKHGQKFGLRLYSIEEYEELFQKTSFKNSYKIEETPIAGFPVFVKIELEKRI